MARPTNKVRGKAQVAAPTLQQLFVAKLAASGLDLKDAKKLRYTCVKSAQQLHQSFPPFGAFQLPYWELNGKPSQFYRVRYLESTLNGFDALTDRKELRYVQLPDQLSEVYLPPLVDWKKVASDPRVPINVTEGELKAAAGCKYVGPTLGLGGVWMFKSSRHGVPFLPQLEAIDWKGREVRVAFDSDALTNPDVLKALHAFCSELAGRGALPKVVRVPPLKPGAKTGLDDLLVASGIKRAKDLLDAAEPFGPVSELLALNAEVVYVRDPGLVVVLGDGRKLTPGAFKEHAFANRHYYEESIGQHGPKTTKKPVAPAWLQWEQRHELACVTYRPGLPRIVDHEYNYWRGWGVEPKRGDASRWRALLEHLFGKDVGARTWFEQWCAWPLQHPGDKLFTAAVVWGRVQGTGKTLVGHSLMQIYGANAAELEEQHLTSPYNEWAENKQFVLGDEITSGEHVTNASQKRAVADRLKGMITRKRLRLNPKYVPSFEVPDCINYYFTSNHPDSFFVEDTDRRYFIWEVLATALERAFYVDYTDWLYKRGGASELFYHLLRVDCKGFDAQGAAPMTMAKELMAAGSLSDLGTWCRRLRDAPGEVLKLGDAKIDGDLFTPAELYRLADPEGKRYSVAALGRELSRAGVRYACGGKTVRLGDGQSRLYAVRQPIKWLAATSFSASKHYADARGAKLKKF
jgi:hypothetical protein